MAENVPESSLQPYPTVGRVLSYARTYALDAAGPNGLSGDLLAASAPTTGVYLNSAWERLQDDLIDAGVECLGKEVLIPNLPPACGTDPALQVFIAWDGYCNGQGTVTTSTLPRDLVQPLDMWQRQTGQASFSPVTPRDGNMPQCAVNSQMLRAWEWRDNKLILSPFTAPLDLKLRYNSYLPDLCTIGEAVDETILVPIMRSTRALAYLIAADFVGPRDGAAVQSLAANAEVEIKRICNRTSRRKAVVQYRRAAFGR